MSAKLPKKRQLQKNLSYLCLFAFSLLIIFFFALGCSDQINQTIPDPTEFDWVLQPEYDEIFESENGKILAVKGDEVWVLDKDDTVRKADPETDYEDLKTTLQMVYEGPDLDRIYGVRNLLGEAILETKFEYIDFNLSEAIVARKGNNDPLMLYDKSGNLIKEWPETVLSVGGYSEGYAVFLVQSEKGGRYGYMDMQGEIVIEPTFSGAHDFHFGYATVAQSFLDGKSALYNDRWGMIDKSGEVVIDFKYNHLGDFGDGLVPFGEEMEDSTTSADWIYGYIDLKESVVIRPQYEYAIPFSRGVAFMPDFTEGLDSQDNDGPRWSYKLINKKNECLLYFQESRLACRSIQGEYLRVLDTSNEKYGIVSIRL